MTKKTLSSANNYFIVKHGSGHAAGLSKNGICYRVGDDGEIVPVVYGDEYALLFDGRTAVRSGQTLIII